MLKNIEGGQLANSWPARPRRNDPRCLCERQLGLVSFSAFLKYQWELHDSRGGGGGGGAGGGGGGGGYGLLPKYTCIFFSLEEDNDLESKDEIDSDSTDLTDDDSDEATDTAVDTDDADTEDSGKKIFRMHRVILLLPFRPI